MLLIVLLTENVQTLTQSKPNQIYEASASSSNPVIGQGSTDPVMRQGSSAMDTISEPTQSSSGK